MERNIRDLQQKQEEIQRAQREAQFNTPAPYVPPITSAPYVPAPYVSAPYVPVAPIGLSSRTPIAAQNSGGLTDWLSGQWGDNPAKVVVVGLGVVVGIGSLVEKAKEKMTTKSPE